MDSPRRQTIISAALATFRRGRRLVVIGALLVTVPTVPAAAVPAFPPAIERRLGLNEPPRCTLCHATTSGGGPLTTRFGRAMLGRGLRAFDVRSLEVALAALQAEQTDSDGDGTGDIDELRAGLDPNVPGDASAPPPEFGCLGRIAAAPPRPLSVAVGVVALLALAGVRRRTRLLRAMRRP